MFITHRSDFVPSILGNDTFIFSGIEMGTYSPWFLCEVPEFEEGDDEAICTTTHLIADIEKLTTFSQSKKIQKSYVVSPGHLNKSDSWAFDRLLTVSKAVYNHEGRSKEVYRFETENGSILEYDLTGLNHPGNTLNFQTILKFQ